MFALITDYGERMSVRAAVLFGKKTPATEATKLIIEKSDGVGRAADLLILALKKIGVRRFLAFAGSLPVGTALIPLTEAALKLQP